MKKVTFNAGRLYDTANTKTDIITLDTIDVKNTDKNKLPYLQMYNCGYRVDSHNIDWQYWNGCIFIDIDSKHYYEEVKKFDSIKLLYALHNHLQYTYDTNFYCIQQSNSGTGYHIIFYFDVDKNETNFKKCAQHSTDIVINTFISLGVEDIIRYKHVVDKCTLSCYQGMFVTSNEILFNEFTEDRFFGHWDTIKEYELKAKEVVHKSDVKEDGTTLFKLESYTTPNKSISYKEHHTRWNIYNALIAVFKDENKVNEEWDKICKLMPEGNGHGYRFYISEPIKNKWFSLYNSEYVNVSLLNEFGYKFSKIFEPIAFNTFEPDLEINLSEKETLSDIDFKYKSDKINYIYAGCGLGKTYMSKKLGAEIDDWDYIFGLRKKWVCVISPMKSINKNSFENNKEWVIVDGDHKKDNFDNIGTFKDICEKQINICTTWESFYMYEMYNIEFDYVIVDEVHTFNMYDYRVNSITNIKRVLPASQAMYKIVMSGTPSNEVNEFDCYKIKVNKETTKVNCDLVFYNDSAKGYIINDIKEWIKDKNHLVLVFKDKTNYKTAEFFNKYGLECDVFNSNYIDTTNYILTNENIKEQITCFSVYGQAGINIYLDSDKKARVYILSNNSLSIIQYANRIRNKETIDKIIIPFKYSNINNSISNIKIDLDIVEANRKLDILKKTKKDFEIFKTKNDSIINLHYGFNHDCINNDMTLNEENYTTYRTIKGVLEYESQIQLIYNRLVDAQMNINYVYLDKDTKTEEETKFRSNVFAGQLKRFDCNMMKQNKKSNSFYLEATNEFNKVLTGDLKGNIEYIFNSLYVMNNCDYDYTCSLFTGMIENIIKTKSTIKKKDITDIALLMRIQKHWSDYYNSALIVAMSDENWTVEKITAAYMRTVYDESYTQSDIQSLSDEAYEDIKIIKGLVENNTEIFEELFKSGYEKLNVENDEITQRIYTYIYNKHNRGKIGGKKGKEITIDGVTYATKLEAASALGISRQALDKRLKKMGRN